MLNDPKEIAIIARAKQPNVRKHNRSRKPFNAIFQDFLTDVEIDNKYFIDLGPGHFDFGELVRMRGGNCVGLDNDPAVVELGRFKGFDVVETTIQSIANGSTEELMMEFSTNSH